MSRAQVYWDIGIPMSEDTSFSEPVFAGYRRQLLKFPLPHGNLLTLRFDPLTSPGTVVIHRATLYRSDRSSIPIDVHLIRGVIGFDQMDFLPEGGVKYHIRTDSLDPQMAIDLKYPIDLRSSYPGTALLAKIAACNLVLLIAEVLLLIWKPGFERTQRTFQALNAAFSQLAATLSSTAFIQVDRLAIWFYFSCALLFLAAVLCTLNGSSIGIDWLNYKVGAPPNVLAGEPQGIRADEIYYQTPYMLNQYFRQHPFELAETAAGSQNVGLFAEVPVKHVTTWVRPQFWPFFFLPADYAFSAWWQAKGLIMATGVFTLLLLLTRSSSLALLGTLWLLFSQFTQWCYSWPSMLPEMCGLVCFTLVFALYLLVGGNRIILAISAVAAAACAINFALSAYVPHQIPYAWAGAFLAGAWIIAHRTDIFRRDGAVSRVVALSGFLALTAALLLVTLNDTNAAIAGIGATIYPGHRLMSGGGYSITTLATHFLAASETATRFPREYSNINESAGFLWLAPITFLCWGRLRALSQDRRVILAGLWAAALLLVCWMVFPIPASVGHFLFLDRVQGVRVVPALGLLNVCIVTLVLSAPDPNRRRLGLDAKFTIALPIVFGALYTANQDIHSYFTITELLLGTVWATFLILFVIEGRKVSLALALLIPNMYLFATVNPVERGLRTITSSTVFDLVQHRPELLHGKWLVFSNGFPPSIFTAVGCDVFNGTRYLPDRQYFPLLAAHGVDVNAMNNLGYVNVEELKPGQPPSAKKGPYGPTLSLSPVDPLIKELGIRYVAADRRHRQ
jgi:hypothetical protein